MKTIKIMLVLVLGLCAVTFSSQADVRFSVGFGFGGHRQCRPQYGQPQYYGQQMGYRQPQYCPPPRPMFVPRPQFVPQPSPRYYQQQQQAPVVVVVVQAAAVQQVYYQGRQEIRYDQLPPVGPQDLGYPADCRYGRQF